MAASVETLSNLERRMTVTVPLEPLQGQIDQRLKEIAKTAKFSGFRPGKAPIGLVNKQYGDQVRDEVFSQAVEASFGEAAEENKLRVAGFPNIEHKPFNETDKELEYVATFEVLPEIKVGDVSKLKVEKPTVSVTEADVKKTLDVLVKQRVSYQPVKRASKKEDRVNVNLTAFMDDEQVESTGDKGLDIVIGEPGRVADFDDAMVGSKAGDNKSFEITYPDDHQPAQIAGKKVRYEVSFNSVSEPVLPKVDADFAKSLGVEDGNIDTMKAEIKASLEQEVERRVDATVKNTVFDGLLDIADFETPKSIISAESNRLMQNAAQNLQQRGMDPSQMQLEPSMFQEQAEKSAKLRLLLSDIVNSNSLQANADQVRAVVERFAESYEKPKEMIDWYYADVKRLDEPSAIATEDNIVTWALEQAKVSDKKVKFDDLMAGA